MDVIFSGFVGCIAPVAMTSWGSRQTICVLYVYLAHGGLRLCCMIPWGCACGQQVIVFVLQWWILRVQKSVDAALMSSKDQFWAGWRTFDWCNFLCYPTGRLLDWLIGLHRQTAPILQAQQLTTHWNNLNWVDDGSIHKKTTEAASFEVMKWRLLEECWWRDELKAITNSPCYTIHNTSQLASAMYDFRILEHWRINQAIAMGTTATRLHPWGLCSLSHTWHQ